jgi:uncharacterized membrane protein YjjP (DUF1212 family)
LGLRVGVLLEWDRIVIRAGARGAVAAVRPIGVNIDKVTATLAVVDSVCDDRMPRGDIGATFAEIEARPPVSLLRFVIMAAAGAAALGVIFGAKHLTGLVVIAISAGLGAALRRAVGRFTDNPFAQPLCAALLAGAIGGIAFRFDVSPQQYLLAVCPCMVLVPGPHLLNGAIDLARARIALGLARTVYVCLIILMICTGLLVGLALGGTMLPASVASAPPAPLLYDVIAAGVAVMAYAAFFSMPWRTVPLPVATGMLAHAARWVVIAVLGQSVEAGALVACLIAGTIAAPLSDRMRLPFAGVAFASVVSLIPGVFLFRMAGGVVGLIGQGANASPALLAATVADGATAFLIMLAMAFGLLLPKMIYERVRAVDVPEE